MLTSNATGVATWEAPVSPVQWTLEHYFAQIPLFTNFDVIDINPGNQTVNTGVNNISLSTMTINRRTKYAIRGGSSSGWRYVNLVLGAGQSCYFMATIDVVDFSYSTSVGALLGAASPSITTATSSYTWSRPTLHTGPLTVEIFRRNGSPGPGYISIFRVS